ncbi:hypothetical protein [Streptomyces sp. NPDC055036]
MPEESYELVFEDPPPPAGGSGSSPLSKVAEMLRERPGEWVRVGEFSDANLKAANIRRGKPVAFLPAGAFEAVARKTGGKSLLYVRFIGDATEIQKQEADG